VNSPFFRILFHFNIRAGDSAQNRIEVHGELAAILTGVLRFFREVPGMAPVASVGAEFDWSVGCGDLVLGCGQRGAFSGVFALAADRALGGVVHSRNLRGIPIIGYSVAPSKKYLVNFLKGHQFL
jgi:hypothetical protein